MTEAAHLLLLEGLLVKHMAGYVTPGEVRRVLYC